MSTKDKLNFWHIDNRYSKYLGTDIRLVLLHDLVLLVDVVWYSNDVFVDGSEEEEKTKERAGKIWNPNQRRREVQGRQIYHNGFRMKKKGWWSLSLLGSWSVFLSAASLLARLRDQANLFLATTPWWRLTKVKNLTLFFSDSSTPVTSISSFTFNNI